MKTLIVCNFMVSGVLADCAGKECPCRKAVYVLSIDLYARPKE